MRTLLWCDSSLHLYCSYRVLTDFLLAIICAHMTHWAEGVLKTHCYLKEHRTISMQTPWTTTTIVQRPLCVPVEISLRCRRLDCAAMATQMSSYLNTEPLRLFRAKRYAQSAHIRLVFYVISQRLLAMLIRYACSCIAYIFAMCIFLW